MTLCSSSIAIPTNGESIPGAIFKLGLSGIEPLDPELQKPSVSLTDSTTTKAACLDSKLPMWKLSLAK